MYGQLKNIKGHHINSVPAPENVEGCRQQDHKSDTQIGQPGFVFAHRSEAGSIEQACNGEGNQKRDTQSAPNGEVGCHDTGYNMEDHRCQGEVVHHQIPVTDRNTNVKYDHEPKNHKTDGDADGARKGPGMKLYEEKGIFQMLFQDQRHGDAVDGTEYTIDPGQAVCALQSNAGCQRKNKRQ